MNSFIIIVLQFRSCTFTVACNEGCHWFTWIQRHIEYFIKFSSGCACHSSLIAPEKMPGQQAILIPWAWDYAWPIVCFLFHFIMCKRKAKRGQQERPFCVQPHNVVALRCGGPSRPWKRLWLVYHSWWLERASSVTRTPSQLSSVFLRRGFLFRGQLLALLPTQLCTHSSSSGPASQDSYTAPWSEISCTLTFTENTTVHPALPAVL